MLLAECLRHCVPCECFKKWLYEDTLHVMSAFNHSCKKLQCLVKLLGETADLRAEQARREEAEQVESGGGDGLNRLDAILVIVLVVSAMLMIGAAFHMYRVRRLRRRDARALTVLETVTHVSLHERGGEGGQDALEEDSEGAHRRRQQAMEADDGV